MSKAGGQAALGGFLYEFVAITGMTGQAYLNETPSENMSYKGYEGLLELVRSGKVQHEDVGQDASIRQSTVNGQSDYVLIQFKFSQQVKAAPIGPKELKEIVRKLSKSAKKIIKKHDTVSQFVLMSNRKLGTKAVSIKENPEDAEGLTSPEKKVLNDLVIYEEQHLESWEQKLEKFGMQFGLKPDECEKSINTLIGSMIKSTGTGHPAQINKEFLIESLTGSRLSQPLQPSSVVKLSKEDVNDFMKSHPSDPIQRHILKDLLKTTMEHALVVVHGDGGCGKSVLLGQWAQSKIESGDTGVFTKIEHGQGVLTTNLIPDIIRNWGCLPESLFSPPNNEDALKRLRTANQNLDNIQILHLGIDAFDEVTDREDREVKNNIRKIMKWFYEKDIKLKNAGEAPAVVLVVTCRNQGKIRELLSSDDYVKFETLFGKVSVDDFMPEELFESASVHVPDLASKIIKELSPSSDPGYFNDELFDDMPSYTPTHNDTLTRTLLHPAMWGCFLKQPREVKTAILDGDTDKAKPMLELYVERFCDKSRRRGILSEKDELTEVIRHIACQSKATGDTQYSVKEWKLWACDSEILLSLYEAEKIRKEALSHGLIRRIDTRKWCWRNIYLRDYLVNLPE